MADVVHSTKVDTWVAVLLLISPAMMVGLAVFALLQGDVLTAATTLGLLAVLALLVVLFVLPMRYVLTDDAIVIRLGLLRLRYPYAEIREVFRSRNPLSGYALSMARLQVVYRTARDRRRFILISPKSRTAFVEDLAERSPFHVLEDGRLLRRREPPEAETPDTEPEPAAPAAD